MTLDTALIDTLFPNPLIPSSDEYCPKCYGTGVWLTPRKIVADCSYLVLGNPHPERNHASIIFLSAGRRLMTLGLDINSEEFRLGQLLCAASSEEPCPRDTLLEFFYGDTSLGDARKLRKLHGMIESLRRHWLLPVGGRKAEPSGYWIIDNIDDYREWYEQVTAAPKTQLSTIHRNARHNFPQFAEQMELEFLKEEEDE